MKIIKKLVIAVVILVVLFIGAGFAASQFINKELVEKQVSQATGREFKITGDLKPGFSLTPSVSAEGVSLSNAKWGSRGELATIGKFNIQLQLLPLFQKKIVVDKIEIDNADILLEQKNGQWNFDFADAATKAENEKDKPVSEKSKLSFNISALNITNSKLTLKQGGAPTIVSVKALKLSPHDSLVTLDFEGVVNNKPLKVTVDLPPMGELMSAKKIDIANLSVISEDMKVKANAVVDNETKKVTINSFDFTKADIKLNGKGWADINSKKAELVSFSGSKGDIALTGHVTADLNAKRVEITNLQAKKGDLKFNGTVTADISGSKPLIRGSLSTDLIDLKPAAGKDGKVASSSSGGKSSGDDKLPLDSLDAANADIKLSIGRLVSGDIVVDKITAQIRLNNGVLVINPLNAGFANGQIGSNITLSKSGARVNLKASDLSMEKILAQTAGNNDFKNGITNADIALAGNGDTVNEIMNSLSGTSKVTMKGGTYNGQILKGRAAQFTSLLTGNNSRSVEINCMVTDINWSNGIGSLKQMGVDTKYANVTGSGLIKLPGHGLNLILTPVSKLPHLNSLAIPLSVKGTFENPQVAQGEIAQKVVENVGKNVLNDFLESKKSGKKFKLSTNSALGIDKNATIASPCGAAPATVAAPAAVEATVPAANATTTTAPDVVQTPQEPAQPLSKQEKKQQKQQQKIEAIGAGLKQLGF